MLPLFPPKIFMSDTKREGRESKLCSFVSVTGRRSRCRRPAEVGSQFCIICQRKLVSVTVDTVEIKESRCAGTTNTGERCTISIKEGTFCGVCKENGPKSIPLQVHPSPYVIPPSTSSSVATPFMAPFYHLPLVESSDTYSTLPIGTGR